MQRRPPFSEHIPGKLIKDVNELQEGDDVYIEFSRKITNIFPKLRKFRAKFNNIKDLSEYDNKSKPYYVANFTSVIPMIEELEIPEEYRLPNVHEKQVKFGAKSTNKNKDIEYINQQRLFGYVGDIIDDKSDILRVNNIKLLINILNITLKSINKEYVKIYKTINDNFYLEKMVSSSLPNDGNDNLTKYTMSFLKSKSSRGGRHYRKKKTMKMKK
jgi:hypothetical protein